MKVRILGVATQPAQLERDGPHAINGCFLPFSRYSTYWIACLSGRRQKLSDLKTSVYGIGGSKLQPLVLLRRILKACARSLRPLYQSDPVIAAPNGHLAT